MGETTGRKIIDMASSETMHKGAAWASLAATVAVAVVGYYADRHHGQHDEALVDGAAMKIAELTVWKAGAERDLDEQAEQIAKLREAVATLKVVAALSSVGAGAQAQQVLADLQVDPGAARQAPGDADPILTAKIKKELLAP